MIIHIIQRGETLWNIAERYGISLSEIIAANSLPDPNRLLIGQSLLIPIAFRQHIVRAGETLWQIAQKYGVAVGSIVQANHISDPSKINPGMILNIPPRIHTVKPGENLSQIS